MQNCTCSITRPLGFILGIASVFALAWTPSEAFGQRISAAQAKKEALASYPGRVISQPKLVTRSGVRYYDVTIRSGEVQRHVLVNAQNGEVVRKNSELRGRSPRTIALAAHPGKVVDGPKRIMYRGKPVHWVTVQSGIVRRTVLVDTQAGSIVKTMRRHTDKK